MSIEARSARPMSRWISLPRPPGCALAARVGRARQHRVLGGDPALAAVLEERRHPLLDGGGADDPGVAGADERRAFGVLEPVGGDGERAKLVGASAVGSRIAARGHYQLLRQRARRRRSARSPTPAPRRCDAAAPDRAAPRLRSDDRGSPSRRAPPAPSRPPARRSHAWRTPRSTPPVAATTSDCTARASCRRARARASSSSSSVSSACTSSRSRLAARRASTSAASRASTQVSTPRRERSPDALACKLTKQSGSAALARRTRSRNVRYSSRSRVITTSKPARAQLLGERARHRQRHALLVGAGDEPGRAGVRCRRARRR